MPLQPSGDDSSAGATTVDFILKLVGDGYTADDIVRECPELEREDVLQAPKYGA